MKRFCLFLLVVLFCCPEILGQRKKVGLVLSGGGAKGVAHIGVLKVLEEAGIPIDYISGTSMGAIVGGLYAVGYNAKALDSLVRVQDWPFLLGDKVYRNDRPFFGKEENEKYLISFSFSSESGFNVPAGFVKGNNIYNLFSDLTVGYHDSISFKKLPIPFACVAANMVDGSEVVMDSGILPAAMRASMAIPGAFSPVVLDSMVLVDGGISNNFPVNVAKDMGAEITIGVDLSTGLKDMKGLDNLIGMVDQLTAFMGKKSYEKNRNLVDLYMNPDLKGYTAASFSAVAIDSMILRGERVARANWDKIMALKKEIGIDENEKLNSNVDRHISEPDSIYIGNIYIEGMRLHDEKWLCRQLRIKEYSKISKSRLQQSINFLYGTGAFSSVNYALKGNEPYSLLLIVKEKPGSSVNLGFHFDSEEMAAILLNTSLSHKAMRGSSIGLTGRLGKNPYVELDYSFGSTFLRKLGVSYMFRYNDMDLYEKDEKIGSMNYGYHRGEINVSDIYLRNFKFVLGLRYEYYHMKSKIFTDVNKKDLVPSGGLFTYCASAFYDTFDKRYYPTKGIAFHAEYKLHTDNMFKYDNGTPFSSLSFDFQPVIRLSRRLCILPALYGRILIGHEIPTLYKNYMGGVVPGRYMNQQLTFYGVRKLEMFDNSVLVGRLAIRQRLWRHHFLTLTGNYAASDDDFFDLFKGEQIWGGGLTYAYDSVVGPISLTLDTSDWIKKVGVYFSLGFYF